MEKPDPSADAPRWQRRPTERRREILDAAVAVFGDQGFDGATLSEVATRAGVCAGTVTHYFGSKGGLFEAALTDRFLGDLEGGEALLATHRGSARALLRGIMTRMWEQLDRPGTIDLVLCTLANAPSFPDATGAMCREIGERWRRLVAAVLTDGIQRGEFRPVDVNLQARVIGAGLFGILIKAHHFAPYENNPPTPEQCFAVYLETIEFSLALPPAAVGSNSPDTVSSR
ncbi:MAG: TetR/AcrR family transcriptional regulator [Gemmatimonadota bacterium]